jgi:hypothetical protein
MNFETLLSIFTMLWAGTIGFMIYLIVKVWVSEKKSKK